MQPEQARTRSWLWAAGVIWLNITFWPNFLLMTFLLALASAIYSLLFDLLFPKGPRARYLIRTIIHWYGRGVRMGGWPLVKVRFVDMKPEEQPPLIYVVNHRSSSDAFLLAVLNADSVQMLNIWPSRVPLINYLSRAADYIRVREIPFDQFLEIGTRLFNEGVSIIAFPEGTRSRTGALGPFHGSAFRLAQQLKTRICPVAIWGSENIPKRGSLLLHPGKIIITKLPSLTYEEYKDMNAYTLKMRVRQSIHECLEAQPA